jgi:hypothetical protein
MVALQPMGKRNAYGSTYFSFQSYLFLMVIGGRKLGDRIDRAKFV